jgi:hypothetical protein
VDEPTRSVRSLQRENVDFEGMQRGMLALLKFIEHSRRQNAISEDTYFEVKGETLKKLAHVKKFARQADYEKLANGYDEEEELEQEQGYDSLDSEELVENFINKISTPTSTQSRMASILHERRELTEAKKNVDAMLSVLEDSYNEGSLSQATYEQLKRENEVKLQQIDSLLNETHFASSQPPAPIRSRMRTGRLPPIQPPFSSETQFEQGDEEVDQEVKQDEFGDDVLPDFEPEQDPQQAASELISQLGITQKFSAATPEELASAPDTPTAPAAAPASKQPEQAISMITKIRSVVAKASGGSQTVAVTVPSEGQVQQQVPPPAAPPTLVPPAKPGQEEPYIPRDPSLNAPNPFEQAAQKATASSGGDAGGKMEIELEKLKTKVDALSEMRDALYERISGVMENVGEVRAIAFSLDGAFKTSEAKSEKFIELVTQVDPQRYMRELEQRDKVLEQHGLRLEKVEAKMEDVVRNVSAVRSLLESVGSLRNISEVNKEIAEKGTRMESMINKAERMNEDLSNTFVDVNRRLEEFNTYRTKQELVVETVKELVTMVDGLNKKLGDYSTKDDTRNLRRELENSQVALKEVSAKIVLAQQGREMPQEVRETKKRIEGVKQVLATNEEEYANKAISTDDYNHINEENLQKMAELNQQLLKQLDQTVAEHEEAQDKSEQISKGVAVQVEQKLASQPNAVQPDSVESAAQNAIGGIFSAVGNIVQKATGSKKGQQPAPAVSSQPLAQPTEMQTPPQATSELAEEPESQPATVAQATLQPTASKAEPSNPNPAVPQLSKVKKVDPDELINALKEKYLKPPAETTAVDQGEAVKETAQAPASKPETLSAEKQKPVEQAAKVTLEPSAQIKKKLEEQDRLLAESKAKLETLRQSVNQKVAQVMEEKTPPAHRPKYPFKDSKLKPVDETTLVRSIISQVHEEHSESQPSQPVPVAASAKIKTNAPTPSISSKPKPAVATKMAPMASKPQASPKTKPAVASKPGVKVSKPQTPAKKAPVQPSKPAPALKKKTGNKR